MKPFIKWVGGKSQLLEQFEKYYPNELKNGVIENYIEPFLGGGAAYFSIACKYNIKKAYLSDLNRDLVLTYLVIQQKPKSLLDFLEQYQNLYNSTEQEKRNDLFLSIRKHFNETSSFNPYSKYEFNDEEQIRLKNFCYDLYNPIKQVA